MMSFFYIKPVEGKIQLHDLHKCIFRRFDHIQLLLSGKPSVVFDEYIIEGSLYDNIGHFSLTMMAVLSKNPKLHDLTIEGERMLFVHRLKNIQENNLRHLCKSIHKDLSKETADVPELYKIPLKILCRKLAIKHLAEHVLNHRSDCTLYNVMVDFKHCIKLVAKREVELNGGQASVPCSKWTRYLIHLYESYLQFKMNKVKEQRLLEIDPRWKEMIATLNEKVAQFNTGGKQLKYSEIDSSASTFPPCMAGLHNALRSKHRLPHNHRFVYSLFLKDIGLPLQDAIYFWQEEYSKPHGPSVCNHSWTENNKKYIYSIRHLYGLEGSRKNYTTPKCSQIQSNSAGSICIFKQFDKSMIQQDEKSEIWTQILANVNKKHFSKACCLYKKITLNKLDIPEDRIYSPVDYYVNR